MHSSITEYFHTFSLLIFICATKECPSSMFCYTQSMFSSYDYAVTNHFLLRKFISMHKDSNPSSNFVLICLNEIS